MIKKITKIFFSGSVLITMCAHGAIYHCNIKNSQSVSADGLFNGKQYLASSYAGSKFTIDTSNGRIISNSITLRNLIDQKILEKGGGINDFKMIVTYSDEYKKIFILEISNNKYFKDKSQKFPFSIYMDKYHMSGLCEQ